MIDRSSMYVGVYNRNCLSLVHIATYVATYVSTIEGHEVIMHT